MTTNAELSKNRVFTVEESLKRGIFQYTLAALVFLIYGVQVCPFLDSLHRPFFITVVSLLFVAMFFARTALIYKFAGDRQSDNTFRQFMIDFAVFVSGGFCLAIGNAFIYQFPIEASLRVVTGFSFLGYFVSLQMMLERQHQFMQAAGNSQSLKPRGFISITLKIQFVVYSLVVGAILTLLMVVWKDFEWLQAVGDTVTVEQATLWLFYEFLFVCIVFCTYGYMIIKGMSKNIKLGFTQQLEVLDMVKQGHRHCSVPVAPNDEFRDLATYTNHMIASLAESEETLHKTRDATILAIASLAEARDNETGAHILRTQGYIRALCLYLQNQGPYQDYLTDERVELIYKSAPLHDIGKVGTPDAILLKPGKLTEEEFEIMKEHPLIGKHAIEKAEEQSGEMPFLYYAKAISESHHEKWDGSGYPQGLKGQDIPLSGRLMALADVYDALISKRVYKPAFPHEKARYLILEGRSSHFDPVVVDAFLAIEMEFVAIAQKYKDEGA